LRGQGLSKRAACKDGDPDEDECTTPSYCDGDVARGCLDGKPFAVDCGETGENCVLTEHGPGCRVRQCDWAESETRCMGRFLFACVEGQLQATVCGEFGATCETLPGEAYPRCVKPKCDEVMVVRGTEVCDGADNDGDGEVDERTECPPIEFEPTVGVLGTIQRRQQRCDSDSIASLAGALIGCRVGESGIPLEWRDELERSAELRALAERAWAVSRSTSESVVARHA
jgi:hypothetical protein